LKAIGTTRIELTLEAVGTDLVMNVFRQSIPCLWTFIRESSFLHLGMQVWQNIV